jgi:hypothetical protein
LLASVFSRVPSASGARGGPSLSGKPQGSGGTHGAPTPLPSPAIQRRDASGFTGPLFDAGRRIQLERGSRARSRLCRAWDPRDRTAVYECSDLPLPLCVLSARHLAMASERVPESTARSPGTAGIAKETLLQNLGRRACRESGSRRKKGDDRSPLQSSRVMPRPHSLLTRVRRAPIWNTLCPVAHVITYCRAQHRGWKDRGPTHSRREASDRGEHGVVRPSPTRARRYRGRDGTDRLHQNDAVFDTQLCSPLHTRFLMPEFLHRIYAEIRP